MKSKKNFEIKLEEHFLAGAPAIYIQSAEEARVDQLLIRLQDKLGLKRIHEWNLGHGWVDFDNKRPLSNLESGKTELEHALLALLHADLEQSLILIKGARLALEHNTLAIARLKQLLNLIERHHAGECSVILVSEAVCIPAPIEAQVTLLALPLPDREEIKALLTQAAARGQLSVPENLNDQVVSGLSGLTISEIGQLLRMMARQAATLDESALKMILHEKEHIIAKSGVLEMVPSVVELGDIGGLENLKHWLEQRSTIIRRLDEATKRGVKAPKGVLIAGMPGCGKSLTAKVAASLFQLPLLRLDIGSLLGKYVGESEHNMRRALSMAETVSPCILWVDELEKAFVGMGGGNASEVTARLLGYFLTWMQEKTGAVFVIATANDISALPPELLRKGRFDEIFYVGFPNAVERESILKIHLGKSNQTFAELEMLKLVKLCRDYCGADIENAVNEALANAFINGSALTQKLLEDAIQSTIPLRETLRDQVGKYEELFEKLKLRPASEYQGLSVAQMIKMAADPNHVKREEVASNPDCPDDQLEKLAMDSQRTVIKAVYENPRCPERLLSIRINIPLSSPQYDLELLELACLNGNAPEDLLIRQINDGTLAKELRTKLASQAKGTTLQQKLAADSDALVRQGLASNRALPEQVLEKFVLDDDADVRRAVGGNLILPESLQFKLAVDDNISVVAALVSNPSLGANVKLQLLEKGASKIKQAFARRPELTAAEQQMLLKNADNPLKLVLAAHPKLAEAIQVQLATDSSSKVRINLAKNLQVTSEVQETLANDTNADVKLALLGNPALCLSEEAKLKLAKFKIENNSPAARMLNIHCNSGLFGNIAATLYSTEN
ncbi:AAA family ATPase [Pseudomonas fragi]|uniref:AAA family ATPase n=1 Tax=Pseudomonas fragi TaxID=296 RepID=UPI000BA1EABB|nr:AAA family ATPase [Pseudomonas fragi]PAA01985.1 AAA family ATPase [Pseudomonas fragi]